MKRLLQLTALLSIALVARAQSLTITTTSAPGGRVGAVYSLPFNAIGGAAPYTWSVTSGTLQAGLALSTNGIISGTPTAAGTTTLTIQVADSATTPATATKDLTLSVVTRWYPYAAPRAITLCQLDTSTTPPTVPNDEVTGKKRCFVVPLAVSVALTQHLLAQTNGLNADGTVAYQYTTWWNYFTQFFRKHLALPKLDEFPPAALATAKANAAAAEATVEDTKATLTDSIAQ
jgi:hypothetical protein